MASQTPPRFKERNKTSTLYGKSVNFTQEEIYWMGSPITAILENTVCILLSYRAGLCLDCSLKANFLHLFQLYSPFVNFVSEAL